MVDEWSVEVIARRSVGPGVVSVQLKSPAALDARPGEFVLVRSRGHGARHFTVSSPDVAETFEITVEVPSDDRLAAWVAGRTPGDAVRVEGPFGRTYYDGGDAVAIGGGPGVGAAVGVAERAVRDGYGATVVVDGPLVHEPRLATLAAAGATVFAVSDCLDGAVADASGRGSVYVFGFRGFIDRVRAALSDAGYDPDEPAYGSYGSR